jgi:hypothetical protein
MAGVALVAASAILLSLLERFPTKWTPVRRKNARPNKNLESRPDSIRSEKALEV